MSTVEDRAIIVKELQIVWNQYQATNRMRIAHALQGGRLLVRLRAASEHGLWLKALEATGIPSSTAHRWMQLPDLNLTAKEIDESGGIVEALRQATEGFDEFKNDAKFPTNRSEMGNLNGHSKAEEPPEPPTVTEALDDVPRAMETPVVRPAKPVPEWQLELDGLRIEIEQWAERFEAMERERDFLKGQLSEFPHEQFQQHNRQVEEIKTLRASRNEWQTKCRDRDYEIRMLRKRVKELEGE